MGNPIHDSGSSSFRSSQHSIAQSPTNSRDTIETLADPDAVAAWLEVRVGDLPVTPSELVAACTTDDLNVARSALGLSLRQLNEAIADLGPPFEQLRNEEGIAQAFAISS